nr:protein longifolia 1-like [Tanacetum cinerariifolium]
EMMLLKTVLRRLLKIDMKPQTVFYQQLSSRRIHHSSSVKNWKRYPLSFGASPQRPWMFRVPFLWKLIFDSVNEILVRKLSSPSKMMQNPRKLLSEVCLEIEQQQVHKKGDMCDLEDGDDLKRLLRKDVLKKSENWTDFHDESPVIAVELNDDVTLEQLISLQMLLIRLMAQKVTCNEERFGKKSRNENAVRGADDGHTIAAEDDGHTTVADDHAKAAADTTAARD